MAFLKKHILLDYHPAIIGAWLLFFGALTVFCYQWNRIVNIPDNTETVQIADYEYKITPYIRHGKCYELFTYKLHHAFSVEVQCE